MTPEDIPGYFDTTVEHRLTGLPAFIKIAVFCLFLFRFAFPAFSGEAGNTEAVFPETEGAAGGTGAGGGADNSPEKKRYFLPAFGHVVISNGLLFAWNRAIMRSPFSKITFQSVKENLVWSAWEWDMDYFPTNFFGHPWHGSTYHAGAAANGFGFYEALLFDGFGSATYELFLETTPPSLNDLVSTSIGGASMGEMFHRLYLEIDSPFMVIVSPFDALNGLITGRKPERGPKKLYSFSGFAGLGWLSAAAYGEKAGRFAAWNWPSVHIEGKVVYGDPFGTESRVPYEHFELAIGGGGSYGWYDMKFVTDGYLFSFSPPGSGKERFSTGLSLCYDFFTSLNVDFLSQGLDWAVKYRRVSNGGTAMEVKAHAGWLGFGGSNYYLYNEYDNSVKSYRDYGTGVNARFSYSLLFPRAGTVSLEVYSYGFFIVSHRVAGSRGWEFCNFITASYTFPLGKNFFLGVSDTVTVKNGRYTSVPGIDKYTNSFKIVTGWTWNGPMYQ